MMADAVPFDREHFFEEYSRLHMVGGDHADVFRIEEAMTALGPLAGRRVIDLGCGFGDFCREASDAGAAGVTGLDVSSRMIARARALTQNSRYGNIDYLVGGSEAMGTPRQPADLVMSNLVLHYVADLEGLLGDVRRALRTGGNFVFSIEHPICSASPLDWEDADTDEKGWGVEGYLSEGPRDYRWFGEWVRKFHRPVSRYVGALSAAGFSLAGLAEPPTVPAVVDAREKAGIKSDRPPFAVFAACAQSCALKSYRRGGRGF